MSQPSPLRYAVLAGLWVAHSWVVFGQEYPTKPIRIVTSGAGGGSDFTARQVAQGISGRLGQAVIVDNRPGVGLIPGEVVSRASPDGYTLLVTSNVLWVLSFMQTAPFDPVRDFAPVNLTNLQPTVLLVHPSLPAKSVKELINLAKSKPGALNYASAGTGSATHLGAELFNSMAGVQIVRVSYKGAAQALSDLIGGQVHVAFFPAGTAMPHVKAGKLRALAVTSANPSALVPGLPTVANSGLPGYEVVSFTGVFAPANTPAVIINRLNQEIELFLNQPEVKERFLLNGSEVVAAGPEQFAAAIKADIIRTGKVIRNSGVKGD